MFSTLTQHKMVILIIALVAAVSLWYGMSQPSMSDTTILVSNANGESVSSDSIATQNPIDSDSQRILEVLLALRAVKLDDTIFSNKAFMSLKDFSTEIVPEPVGRPDPFAPIGEGASVTKGAKI